VKAQTRRTVETRVCQACLFSMMRTAPPIAPQGSSRRLLRSGSSDYRLNQINASLRRHASGTAASKAKRFQRANEPPTRFAKASSTSETTPIDFGKLAEQLEEIKKFLDSHDSQTYIPAERAILVALRALAEISPEPPKSPTPPEATASPEVRGNASQTAASGLLSIERRSSAVTSEAGAAAPTAKPTIQTAQLWEVQEQISETAYNILKRPTVFITPKILEEYVKLQAKLGQPESLPEVFRLYASKPHPSLKAGKLELSPTNPNKAANAIEPATADAALDAAIEAKNLELALAIVEQSYAAPAFLRAKFVKRALFPVSGLAVLPFGIYGLATKLATLQESMDAATATNVAFVGILAYVGFTATLGVVVISTANDQMKRVRWAPGLPLRRRWLREEERAALDKIACSFGFSEETRFGEEEGADFEILREWVLQRGMLLDQLELMEGMS
jgi:hypothetical protein